MNFLAQQQINELLVEAGPYSTAPYWLKGWSMNGWFTWRPAFWVTRGADYLPCQVYRVWLIKKI